jgi:NAD(P)-dependent dehydrogenase (short-subunit alcohol dehydrogenase family)
MPPRGGPAAKAAGWAMTDPIRQELAPRGIQVTAVHVGYMDTDMVSYIPADQKTDPAVVAKLALDGLFAGEPESSCRQPVTDCEGAAVRGLMISLALRSLY